MTDAELWELRTNFEVMSKADALDGSYGWVGEIARAGLAGLALLDRVADRDKPISMILHCPACGLQHIDEPETVIEIDPSTGIVGPETVWDNPPHRSHLCRGCGHIWRPADVATTGVKTITTTGKADSTRADPETINNVLRKHIDTLIEQASEVVSDEIDQASGVPWMRCSPNLPAYIVVLCADRDRLAAEVGRLRTVINTAYGDCLGALYWGYDPNTDASRDLPRALAEVLRVMSGSGEVFDTLNDELAAAERQVAELRAGLELMRNNCGCCDDDEPCANCRRANDLLVATASETPPTPAAPDELGDTEINCRYCGCEPCRCGDQ